MITTQQLLDKYGKPGDESKLVRFHSPFELVIAWDLSRKVTSFMCHKLIAKPLENAFVNIYAHYGHAAVSSLGINLFGGCVNVRPKRGLEKKYDAALKAGNFDMAYSFLSRHAWGTAIDLDPARNQLKETSKTARFARPEYAPMIDIFYANGFISYGRERNNDFMHFEIGS